MGYGLEEGILRSVHGGDQHSSQDRSRHLVRKAESAGAGAQVRMGRGNFRRRRIRAGRARGPAREGGQDGREGRSAAAGDRARLRHRLLFACRHHRLSQGQVSKRGTADLGGFLGREALPRRARHARSARDLSRLCLAGRRRAARQALSVGYRSRLPQAERAQAARQGLVDAGRAITAAHPRWRRRHDRDVERARRRVDRGQGADRDGVEWSGRLRCLRAHSKGRSQCQGRMGVLWLHRTGETAGRLRDVAALWPGQSGGSHFDD